MSELNFNPLDDLFDEGLYFWLELKKGNKNGLESLYLKFSKELFRYGMVLKPNSAFVQDCIQDLFLDLWKYRTNLSEIENVRNYLLRSLSNKIGKEIKKESRFTKETNSEDKAESFSIHSIEEELIIIEQNESLIARLRNELLKLPVREREVINFLFFEKLTYEETSKRMEIHTASCYTLAWKAIRRLRACL